MHQRDKSESIAYTTKVMKKMKNRKKFDIYLTLPQPNGKKTHTQNFYKKIKERKWYNRLIIRHRVFLKIDIIWDVRGIQLKIISFRTLIIGPLLAQMI